MPLFLYDLLRAADLFLTYPVLLVVGMVCLLCAHIVMNMVMTRMEEFIESVVAFFMN